MGGGVSPGVRVGVCNAGAPFPPPWNDRKAEEQNAACFLGASLGRVRAWLFAAEQGAKEDDPGHGGPRQQPLVEALLAFPALGGRVVPVQIHKPLLKAKGEHRVRRWGKADRSRGTGDHGGMCLVVVVGGWLSMAVQQGREPSGGPQLNRH